MPDAQIRAEERLLRATEGRPLPLRKLQREGRVSDALIRALAYCGDGEARALSWPDAEECPGCDGTGLWDGEPCTECGGNHLEAWARGLDPILRACGRDVFVRVLERIPPDWGADHQWGDWAEAWWGHDWMYAGIQWYRQLTVMGADLRPAVLAALREEVSRA